MFLIIICRFVIWSFGFGMVTMGKGTTMSIWVLTRQESETNCISYAHIIYIVNSSMKNSHSFPTKTSVQKSMKETTQIRSETIYFWLLLCHS